MSRGGEQVVAQFSFGSSAFQLRIACASFVCRVVGGEDRRAWEAVEAGYFAFEEVPEKSNGRNVEMVSDALDLRAGLRYRVLVEQGLV
jgi:hypothetical protein